MSNANAIVGKKSKGQHVCVGILILGLAAMGATYPAVANAQDAKKYKPVNQMAAVDP